MSNKKKNHPKLDGKELKKPKKRVLTPEFYLGTSIAFFFAALSHLEEAIKWFLTSRNEYRFFMITFIVFLCLSFFLLGMYFGKRNEASYNNKRES